MAKMIKCPTCATQIEVPAGPGAQVIKCPGCGKGLKIVAKKPPGAPGGPGGSVAGGSMAGTVAGGSVSGASFHAEPPPRDDLPSLEYTCQVCGTPTDPDRLIEDNGLLKCPDCIKGNRSKIDRPDEAPDLVEFKRPLPPARRGKLIRITPGFIGFSVAALVFIGCQVYLTLIEEPRGRGRAIASPVQPDERPEPLTPPASTQPAPPPLPIPQVSTGQDPPPPPASADHTDPSDPGTAPDGTEPPSDAPPASTAPTEIAGRRPMFDDGLPATPPGTAPPGTAPSSDQPPTDVAVGPDGAPPSTNVAVAALPTDPLALGLYHLREAQPRDYRAAHEALTKAQGRRVAGRIGAQLSPEQQLVLEGLAAANIGRNQPEAAMAQLNLILGSVVNPPTPPKGLPTRAAVLNYAIAVMSKPRAAPAEIVTAVDLMRQFLQRQQGDEYAADIFGTLLERVAANPNLSRDDKLVLQQHTLYLDGYINTLAQENRPNELKWGIEWKPRDQVLNYRAARGHEGTPVAPEQLQRELVAAKQKVMQLEQALALARATPGSDVVGAQNQLNAAHATLGSVQMKIEQAAAPAPKPRWLEKLQPVLPEGNVMQ